MGLAMAGSQVLEILRDIEADTFRNAAPLPAKRDARPEWQGLGFQVGGVRLVAALGEVGEILTVPRVTRLPRVKEWILGIANVRGRLVPIVDLHRFLNVTTTTPKLQWRLLIVETPETRVGLVVEQSLGLQHFVADTFEQGRPDGLAPLHPFIDGAYRHAGRVFYLVRLSALVRDERFTQVAQ
jgi:twitching motility protein PilI